MAEFWHLLLRAGRDHGVDPYVFGLLYLVHVPLFWGTMALALNRARLRKPYVAVVALDVFWLLTPYIYVFLFGHGLPWWVYALVVLCVALGIIHVRGEFRRRSRSSA